MTKTKKTYLLSVPGEGHIPVVVVLQDYVSQLGVRDILHYVPFNGEEPIPHVNLPKVHVLGKINWSNHFSYTHKLAAFINLALNRQINQRTPTF